ncbi:hypothetical protein ACWCYY_16360 [Kitasatospora sp. NPDC001664]
MEWTSPQYAELVEQWRQPADSGTEILSGPNAGRADTDAPTAGRGFIMGPPSA